MTCLPAGLVAADRKESAFLTLLTQVAWVIWPGFPIREPYAEWSWAMGTVTLWSGLIPALALVLLRSRRSAAG